MEEFTDIRIPEAAEIAGDQFTTARELLIICTQLKARLERQNHEIKKLQDTVEPLRVQRAELETLAEQLRVMTGPKLGQKPKPEAPVEKAKPEPPAEKAKPAPATQKPKPEAPAEKPAEKGETHASG